MILTRGIGTGGPLVTAGLARGPAVAPPAPAPAVPGSLPLSALAELRRRLDAQREAQPRVYAYRATGALVFGGRARTALGMLEAPAAAVPAAVAAQAEQVLARMRLPRLGGAARTRCVDVAAAAREHDGQDLAEMIALHD